MGSGDGLGGCHACIKYLMFAFNFIFWLIGCALVGVGIWVLVDDGFKKLSSEYDQFEFLKYGGMTLIIIGGVIMVVGFFGCCGAIRESQCLLATFFVFMLILFLVLVAAGVAALLFKDEVSKAALDKFRKDVQAYYKTAVSKEYVDLIQKTFKCCGADSPLDYSFDTRGVPESCMEGVITGCATLVPKKLDENVILAAGIALGAGFVMLIGMVFSMLLCCAIGREV